MTRRLCTRPTQIVASFRKIRQTFLELFRLKQGKSIGLIRIGATERWGPGGEKMELPCEKWTLTNWHGWRYDGYG